MSGLHVEAVHHRISDQTVLDGTDLMVPTGCVLTLLGASGCGKTTLLRAIAGFDPPAAGTIRLGGRVLDALGVHVPAEKRGIGFVPQEGTLFPHLDVAGNVGFGLRRAERRGGRIAEVLRMAELEGLERRYPNQISGGQQQRVALARALAPRPSLVLLDEPFNALDLSLRRSVAADVIALLRASAATAILVTHDPYEAFASADLVAVMHAGRITQCAEPAIVYHRPANLETARLTGGTIELRGIVHGDHVETPLGRIKLSPGSIAHGAAHVVLRPEQVVPVTSEEGIAARRLSNVFRGDHTLATIMVDNAVFDIRTNSTVDVSRPLYLRTDGACMAFSPPQRPLDAEPYAAAAATPDRAARYLPVTPYNGPPG